MLSDGRINLKVNVSVSELADRAAVDPRIEEQSRSRTFVPSLKERSASATVELGDGQSMALAGLLDDNLREVVTKFPGLGSTSRSWARCSAARSTRRARPNSSSS